MHLSLCTTPCAGPCGKLAFPSRHEVGADGERGEQSKMYFKGVLEFHLEAILFLINFDPSGTCSFLRPDKTDLERVVFINDGTL